MNLNMYFYLKIHMLKVFSFDKIIKGEYQNKEERKERGEREKIGEEKCLQK